MTSLSSESPDSIANTFALARVNISCNLTSMERSTKQRAAIQEALGRLGRPLLPKELLAEAQKSVPNLSLATIYRNIKALVADGLVEVVSLPGEVDRYEVHKHHHHHFHCNSCQQVIDIDGCPGDLSKLMPKGYSLEGHQITLYGRCPACSAGACKWRHNWEPAWRSKRAPVGS